MIRVDPTTPAKVALDARRGRLGQPKSGPPPVFPVSLGAAGTAVRKTGDTAGIP